MRCSNRTIFAFPNPANGGLGDRFGQYVQLATIAELRCLTIVTIWNTDGGRGNEYPNNIHDYVRFPPTLQFVLTVPRSLPSLRNAGPGYEEGFDHIPETSYRMLLAASVINATLEEYMTAFKVAAASIWSRRRYILPGPPYRAVHLRRGDRGDTTSVPGDLARHLKGSRYVVVSDTKAAVHEICKNIICIKKPRVNASEVALRDFFLLAGAEQIIQSIRQTGRLGGWTSFSYMASAMGNVPLIACVPPHTRITLAQRYCRCNLSRVHSCNTAHIPTSHHRPPLATVPSIVAGF